MMRTIRLGAVAPILFLTAAFAGGTPADDPLVPRKIEFAKPPMPKKDQVAVQYGGTVTEVTKDSIAIQWPGEPAKPFLVSETLAEGKFPVKERPSANAPPNFVPRTVLPPFRYRLTDVKVGDRVEIIYAHLGDIDICDQICIIKRPGGRVPPLPEGAEPLKDPDGKDRILYHERKNAHWDLVDKGIPYPEKFGKNRRFPVAPMPREVKPAPPIAP